MRKHRDLIAVLKSNKMRITPGRRLLLQYVIDNMSRQISFKEIQTYLEKKLEGVDRSSIYRNIETLKSLDILQELDLPQVGKRFQYVFDRNVHHFYICKKCGGVNRGNKELFAKIEKVLKDIHGFSKANLSVVFYGYCAKCGTADKTKKKAVPAKA